MAWTSMNRLALIFFLGCPAAAGCRGADKDEPSVDDRVLARAADHFKTQSVEIGARLLCRAPKGGGSVFETFKKNRKDGARAFIILKGGKAYGPGDKGHGAELAFEACHVRDRLPADALLAARVFFAMVNRSKGPHESIVDNTEILAPAEDGINAHAPALSIIEGGWNLTFWTHDPDACTYTRTKVFILRTGSIEPGGTDSHAYACP